MLLSVVIIIGGAISGSVAWLVDTSSSSTAVFTVGQVKMYVGSTEEPMLFSRLAKAEDNTLRMVPGSTLTINDPPVTILAGSEDCYLFVKIDENTGDLPTDDFQAHLSYQIVDGWTAAKGETIPDGVYYRVVERMDEDQTFTIVQDHHVKVSMDITNEMMDKLIETGNTPTLTFTAYAVQLSGGDQQFSVADAWAIVSDSTNAPHP